MKGHPGGAAHTRRLVELAALPAGASVLDLGAGAGESLALLRSVGLSLHVGSLYLGAAQVRFDRYLLGSVLGLLPVIIPDTVMGTSIHDPSSPAFVIALAAKIVSSVLSMLIALLLQRRSRQKAAQDAGNEQTAEAQGVKEAEQTT